MSTTDTEPRAAVITPAQIKTINAARTVLAEILRTNHYDYDTQASGMVVALADVADGSLFQLLNWYNSHACGELTAEQIHNRADEDDDARDEPYHYDLDR